MGKIGPLLFYKAAKWFSGKGIPILPAFLDRLNRLIFSCWLPHTCEIGENLILGYSGLAIVIHAKAVIGDNVHIDQCVTIGGNGTDYGAPKIGSNVYIGAGAKILGNITVGSGSVIGANAVIVSDLPDNCVAVGVPGKIIRHDIVIDDFLYHLRS